MPDRDIVLLLLTTLITACLLLWAAIYMIDYSLIAADPVLDRKSIVAWLRLP
ncbi:MAG: hypothetical protein V4517_03085 [Pseudomonadota bacterium]